MTYEPWNPGTITVVQYIVIERLAETFSAEIFGEDALGPWARMHNEEQLQRHRATFRDVVEQGGDPRPYMFGDWAAEEFHYDAKGLPDDIGYGMGYRIVRSYLDSMGTTATEATYVPWQEIIAGSAWLHEDDSGTGLQDGLPPPGALNVEDKRFHHRTGDTRSGR